MSPLAGYRTKPNLKVPSRSVNTNAKCSSAFVLKRKERGREGEGREGERGREGGREGGGGERERLKLHCYMFPTAHSEISNT